jgi:hypothetical protein
MKIGTKVVAIKVEVKMVGTKVGIQGLVIPAPLLLRIKLGKTNAAVNASMSSKIGAWTQGPMILALVNASTTSKIGRHIVTEIKDRIGRKIGRKNVTEIKMDYKISGNRLRGPGSNVRHARFPFSLSLSLSPSLSPSLPPALSPPPSPAILNHHYHDDTVIM